jgi:hypothetical protein
VPWWHTVAIGELPSDTPITDSDVELANILEGITKVVLSRSMSREGTDASVLAGDLVRNCFDTSRRTTHDRSRLSQRGGKEQVGH